MTSKRLFCNPTHQMQRLASTRNGSKPEKHRVTPGVFITEVLHHSGLQIRTPDAEKARLFEIGNLVRRGTWEMILENHVPKGANMITGSFFLSIEMSRARARPSRHASLLMEIDTPKKPTDLRLYNRS